MKNDLNNSTLPDPNPPDLSHIRYEKPRTKWARPHGLFLYEYEGCLIDAGAYLNSKGFVEDQIDRMIECHNRNLNEK